MRLLTGHWNCIFQRKVRGKAGGNDECYEKNARRQLDIGKIMALHNAGWTNAQIAEEMGVLKEKIYKCIYYQLEKGK